MLSLETTLVERLQYEPQNVSHDELHDMALDLEEWRKLGDSPQDVQEQITTLKEELKDAENSSDNWEDRYKDLVQYLSNNYATDTFDAKTLELMGEG